MRDPLSIANVDSLLDTVTALVADCDHESIKRLKNIEAYTSRCKLTFRIRCFTTGHSVGLKCRSYNE